MPVMSDSPLVLRDATADDAAVCAEIYRPYVTDTVITFEVDPPTADDMASRIAAAQAGHAWLVAEREGRVIGYAQAGRYLERAAYRWSCTVGIYLETGVRRSGAGRALYTALLERLAERGFRMAIAGVTLPNGPSLGLHAAFGFTSIGIQRRIGWKSDAWHDVEWLQLPIDGGEDPPAEPR